MLTHCTTLDPQQTSTIAWETDGTPVYGWSVRDHEGGIWYPADDALTEILEAGDIEAQADRAYELCLHHPMRGEWHA